MKNQSEIFSNDCPFLDLLGLKKKEKLTEEQKFGKALLDIAKKLKKS